MKKIASILLLLLLVPTFTFAQSTQLSPAERAALEAELRDVEAQIKEQEAILKKQQAQSSTLAGDIAILNAKISKAKLDIKAKTILIQGLSKDITTKQTAIGKLTDKIDREHEALAQLLRRTHEVDTYSLPEILLSQKDLSEFFVDLGDFDSLKRELHHSFIELKQTKDETHSQKQNLENKRSAESDAKLAIEANQREIQKNQKLLNNLLGLSKQQEKNYQSQISERSQRAAAIRSALFALRDSAAIPFAKAFEYATLASQKTGVRPAFLLAILTQESSLGKNVGACYITNFDTGAGIRIASGAAVEKVMKAERDIAPFKVLATELGFDPTHTRVSCPLSIGYGGAMGPAQFIPSTWQLFKARLRTALDTNTPNPWEPRDAFMASAMYLADLGAGAQTYAAERNAACRYYSGSTCAKATAAPYGNQVMAKAQNIQENMIDLIQNN